MYKDRIEAGGVLADALRKYTKTKAVVLGIPRGGVPVAYVVARELGLPLDITLSKKIGHPNNKEFAIGAVSLTGIYINPYEHVSDMYIEEESARIREKLLQMQEEYTGGRQPVPIKNKTVIVIDDGIATGQTLMATLRVLKESSPSKIVLAVPVAPESTLKKLSTESDEIICTLIPDQLYSVGQFYEKFGQVADQKVIEYLEAAHKEYHSG